MTGPSRFLTPESGAFADGPGDPVGEYEELRKRAGVADLSDRAQVLVSGPDARSFLQSLISQDLDSLADGDGASSLLLEPRGRLVAAFRALRVGEDEWWLDADPGCGKALTAGLLRYRVRVKVEVTDRGESCRMLRVLGPEAPERAAALLGVAVPSVRHAHVALGGRAGSRLVRADLPGLPGVDVLGPVEDLVAVWRELTGQLRPVGRGVIEIVRIEAGVPLHGRELDSTVIAQEAFLERDAVSFTKGCFLGQELVCRVEMRGHVNRFLRGLTVSGEDLPPPGSPLRVGGAEVGHVTSAAVSPRLGVVALAYVRREVEPPARAEVETPAGPRSAEVVELPYPPPMPRSGVTYSR